MKLKHTFSAIYMVALLIIICTVSCTEETFVDESEADTAAQEVTTEEPDNSNARISSFSSHHYVGNLEYVLGDVKQAQITDVLNSTTQVDHLLDGFEEMGVNGIRIAIFADGVNPNETMYDYLYNQVKSRGFKVFANPAQHSGAQRIANGILDGTGASVLGQTWAKNNLVNRIKAFAAQYPCDWICPFNEDGAPGVTWYANQFNNVYAELSGNVNGADLIGPCSWGLPASLATLEETNIENYITVATSHNLGFNHSVWSDFIAEAGSLPVWDSETNDFQKFSNLSTRIDAAIDAGVDGLVLYNSWNTINRNTGELYTAGQEFKDKFIQYYYIKNKETGKRVKPYDDTNEDALMVQVPNAWNGIYSQWELVPTNSGYFQLKNRGSGMYIRPVNNNDYANIVTKASFSGNGYHTQWTTSDAGNGYVFLTNRGSGKKMRSRNFEDISTSTDVSTIKINQVPASWTGDWTQWELIEDY